MGASRPAGASADVAEGARPTRRSPTLPTAADAFQTWWAQLALHAQDLVHLDAARIQHKRHLDDVTFATAGRQLVAVQRRAARVERRARSGAAHAGSRGTEIILQRAIAARHGLINGSSGSFNWDLGL